MKKPETKAELLARIRDSVNPTEEFTLKELAWAYVHGAPANTGLEDKYRTLLIAKAKKQ